MAGYYIVSNSNEGNKAMKILVILVSAVSLIGCAPYILPEDDPTRIKNGYVDGNYSCNGCTPSDSLTIKVDIANDEVDYDRLYRAWEVRDRRYDRGPRRGGYHGRW